MESFEKIIVLNNGIEAGFMDEILTEKDIPHIIVSYADTAYDGVFQMQYGWGHIEAENKDKKEIEVIYNEIKKSNLPADMDT